MKNIYIFDEYTSSRQNGIGTYLQELLYCLKTLKHNICLIVFNAPTDEFNIIEEEIKKMLFPASEGFFLLQTSVINKFLRLYIEDSSDNVFYINHAPCCELLQSLKTYFPLSRTVLTIHDLGWTMPFLGDSESYVKFINGTSVKKYEKNIADKVLAMFKEDLRMYNLADNIICLSKDTVSLLRNLHKVNESKLHFIPNGIRKLKHHCSKFKKIIREDLRLHPDDKILLFIGRPTKQKGIYDLLTAMNEVLKHFPDVKLVIIGNSDDGSFKEMMKTASKNATSIIYTGQIDKKLLKKWMTIADVGIVPSYYEQCTYSGIEMLMYGLPIVASDGFGVRYMFTDGVNAKVAKIGNRKNPKMYQSNLAAAIIELLQSLELCEKLRKGALESYQSKYNIMRMSAQYEKLIESLQ